MNTNLQIGAYQIAYIRNTFQFVMRSMKKLNLPEYNFRIQKSEKGLRIFDPLRKKFVSLTPEEWVRQNFISYLIEEKKYPASLIAIETGLTYNRLKKRSDILIYDRKGNAWMIIECKKPDIKITQETFNQVAVYNMSNTTKTQYLAVTNGLKHYCCKMNDAGSRFDFLKTFPEFPEN